MTRNLQHAIINDILKIVSIKSFTGTDGIKKCQTEIVKIAKSLGFEVSIRGKKQVIVIEPKSKTETPELGIITHLDTVPFDSEEWIFNPLGEISNGRIYGRGVLDDKAAIIFSMYAFYLLKDWISPSWQIIIGSSEERDWIDMKAYLEEGHILPKFSVTIDGDGIQNGSKGYLDLELKFIKEKNQNKLLKLYVPNGKENTVPQKAVAIIENQTLEENGKAAHSSIPDKGENALIKLANSIYKNYQPKEFIGFFKMMNILKSTFDATSIGFPKRPEILNKQYVGFTTVCPTMCSLNKDSLSVNLNFRLCPGITPEDIRRAIKYIADTFNCTCFIKKLEYPVYVSPNSIEIQYMLDAYEKVLGKKTTSTISNGIGYNAIFPNCVIFGPRFANEDEETDTCHATNENRSIEDLFKFFDMFVLFCKKYLRK